MDSFRIESLKIDGQDYDFSSGTVVVFESNGLKSWKVNVSNGRMPLDFESSDTFELEVITDKRKELKGTAILENQIVTGTGLHADLTFKGTGALQGY